MNSSLEPVLALFAAFMPTVAKSIVIIKTTNFLNISPVRQLIADVPPKEIEILLNNFYTVSLNGAGAPMTKDFFI